VALGSQAAEHYLSMPAVTVVRTRRTPDSPIRKKVHGLQQYRDRLRVIGCSHSGPGNSWARFEEHHTAIRVIEEELVAEKAVDGEMVLKIVICEAKTDLLWHLSIK
jgi:hypothetical protein